LPRVAEACVLLAERYAACEKAVAMFQDLDGEGHDGVNVCFCGRLRPGEAVKNGIRCIKQGAKSTARQDAALETPAAGPKQIELGGGTPGHLHHLALAVETAVDVDAAHAAAMAARAEVLHAPRLWPQYHADYYATFSFSIRTASESKWRPLGTRASEGPAARRNTR
jgi:hypothetical protein